MEALTREVELQKNFFSATGSESAGQRLDTIYLGGGTPSVLTEAELSAIFEAIAMRFTFDRQSEITLEANPDDLSIERLAWLSRGPVNRLSIGIQSFSGHDLSYMHRIHSPSQALLSVENAMKAGFVNLTTDLIYGTPGLSDETWSDNLLRLIRLGVPHISAYALTVEKRTALDVLIRKGKSRPVDEEQVARQFEILLEVMSGHGYLQYEISNFALPGHFSRHNLSYWTGLPYLGLGPSAHSYRDGQRWWNVSNTTKYIASIGAGVIPCETEVLNDRQQFDEYVMTSLRTMWGCSLNQIESQWGNDRREAVIRDAGAYIDRGLMEVTGNHLVLTDRGKLFADGIASELFWI